MLMHEKTCVIPIFSIRVENSVDHLILIRCPCQNPADLDLQCFPKRFKSRFSRARIYPYHIKPGYIMFGNSAEPDQLTPAKPADQYPI